MRGYLWRLVLLLLLVGWTGCSEKNYFEPTDVHGEVRYDGVLEAPIVQVGYAGATLSDGRFITDRGISKVKLPEGYHFVSQTDQWVVASKACKKSILYNLKTHQIKPLPVEVGVIAAAYFDPKDGRLAFVLRNNRYGLYDLQKGRILAIYDSDQAFSADIRIANPLKLDQLFLIPTLDGRLAVLDRMSGKKVREIIVGKGEAFNNIIFLEVIADRLVAATPHRIISVSPQMIDAQTVEISDVIFLPSGIYIFAKDGTLYRCDVDLKIVAQKKLPFAHFVGAIYGEYLYAVEKEGYIVAFDQALDSANVFALPDKITRPFFAAADTFYYDRYYFKLHTSKTPREGSDLPQVVHATTKEDAEKSISPSSIWRKIKDIFKPDESDKRIHKGK